MGKVLGKALGFALCTGLGIAVLSLNTELEVGTVEAHQPLCTQSGFTTWPCDKLSNGKYFTASIPFGSGNLDYPNDVYLQNPTCDCVDMGCYPIIGCQQLCGPRSRAANSSDPPPKPGSQARPIYCGTSAGAHIHTKP